MKGKTGSAGELTADTIYYNGVVIPMTGEATRGEAVAVAGEEILEVGSWEAVAKYRDEHTVMEDLTGAVLLPGFYDAHSHFGTVGLTAKYHVDLNSPPLGTMCCVEDYLQALRERAEQTPPGEPIFGSFYDETLIREMRPPTRWELDGVSTKHPIILDHVTSHNMTVNSLTLQLAGIDENTPDPPGGVIRRNEDGVPIGTLEENAVLIIWFHEAFHFLGTRSQLLEALEFASELYARKGVTTANEGSIADPELYQEALALGKLKIRAELWFAPEDLLSGKIPSDMGSSMITAGGAKLFQDGSLSCRTAHLTEPYLPEPSSAGRKGAEPDVGYPARTPEELNELVRRIYQAGFQVYAHCNGDAAIDAFLTAVERAAGSCDVPDARPVCVHAQTAREDQLLKMKELGMIPTFYVSNLYYVGDRFRELFLGEARAERCDPIGSAMKLGLPATMHTDAPVQPQDPLFLIWTAVNRRTAKGQLLGPEERLTPYQALCAVTSYPAYQNKEEARKGTIEKGKLADFVVLDRNPLEIDPMEIKNIQVLRTIVGNRTVYRARQVR